MDTRVHLTLFRHGLTKANEHSQYIGWSNQSLSDKGRKETAKIGQPLTDRIEYVFTSNLKRCTETAHILFPHHQLHEMANLREMNFGNWEEKSYDDLKHLSTYQQWITNPFTSGPDGGETFSQFNERIMKAFKNIQNELQTKKLHDVAIVTHGGVIRTLLMMFVASDKTFFDWHIPYASGYRLSWKKDDFRRGNTCTSLQVVPITEKQHG